jgi:very-short-patch-repair endonuclease
VLEALIYMGVEEPAFRAQPGLRPRVWRVAHVRDAVGGKVEMPARVFHVLQVDGAGERGLAQIAGAQRALVHLRQLRALGISRGAYNHRIAAGSLHRVLPSVLSVVDPLIEPLAAETAALLYGGDDTVLSHDSAAALWGLTTNPSFVAITVIGRHIRSRPGLHVHQVTGLDVRDVRIHQGFPVTAPARTLIDCARGDRIDRMLNEARVLKLVRNSDLVAAMDRAPRRPGVKRLRELLEAEDDAGFTRLEAERRLKLLIAEAGIERPVFNAHVQGFEVDACWPRYKVVIEVDGYAAHGHQQAFQRDRAKGNQLVGGGYVVLRFTWHQLTRKPKVVLAEIVRALTVRIHTNLVAPKTVGSPQT